MTPAQEQETAMEPGVEQLRQDIIADYGERCPDYEPNCICCTVWRAFDGLVKRCPDLSAEEAYMAMHWLDRYAVGIDVHPQLYRIRPAQEQETA